MRSKFYLSLPFGLQAFLPTAPIRAGYLPLCMLPGHACHSPLPSLCKLRVGDKAGYFGCWHRCSWLVLKSSLMNEERVIV